VEDTEVANAHNKAAAAKAPNKAAATKVLNKATKVLNKAAAVVALNRWLAVPQCNNIFCTKQNTHATTLQWQYPTVALELLPLTITAFSHLRLLT